MRGALYQVDSPKHGSKTSASLTLPVPAIQVHEEGVPPGDSLFVGQETHAPEATY